MAGNPWRAESWPGDRSLGMCAVRVVAITDSPLARSAGASFEVVEAEIRAFRSLSASTYPVLALGDRLETTASCETQLVRVPASP